MLVHNKWLKTHKTALVFREKYPKITNLESAKLKQ